MADDRRDCLPESFGREAGRCESKTVTGAPTDGTATSDQALADQVSSDAMQNVAQATKNAAEAVRLWIETVGEALDKAPLAPVLTLVFRAIDGIEESGTRNRFLSERNVRPHGNAKNPYQPYLRAFAHAGHPIVRTEICKQAALIALARHQRIPPNDFDAWQRSWPIEKACREYRAIMKSEQTERSSEEMTLLAASAGNQRDQSSTAVRSNTTNEPMGGQLFPATPITRGLSGKKAAILKFAEDGSGEFRVLKVFPRDLLPMDPHGGKRG